MTSSSSVGWNLKPGASAVGVVWVFVASPADPSAASRPMTQNGAPKDEGFSDSSKVSYGGSSFRAFGGTDRGLIKVQETDGTFDYKKLYLPQNFIYKVALTIYIL